MLNKLSYRIGIVLCSYNGEKFIDQQLRSISQQTFCNWDLWIFDDGSTDSTREILRTFQISYPQNSIYICDGPKMGFGANFLNGMKEIYKNYDFIAFCDQDDIWHPRKLEKAIDELGSFSQNRPAIYSCNSIIVDANGGALNLLYNTRDLPSIGNILVQNFIPGNTMFFNKSLCEIIAKSDLTSRRLVHDWLVMQIAVLFDAKIILDHDALIYYRQHEHNLIGVKRTVLGKLSNFVSLLTNGKKDTIKEHWNILSKYESSLTEKNGEIFKRFYLRRKSNLFIRLGFLFDPIIYRTKRIESVTFLVLIIVGIL